MPTPKNPYAMNAIGEENTYTNVPKRRATPPIQGNEATTMGAKPGYDNLPAQDKGGNPNKLPEVQGPQLVTQPTTAPQPKPKPPAPAPTAAAPPSNNIVIRQWNLNRGIKDHQMRWDPATQALMMDGRPVFQVGRNMTIDAQGNGVTDEATWRQEMQRYGYGEHDNSNIPDNERRLLNGAESTFDPNVYWQTALGQAELQNIKKNRDNAMILARNEAGARGASTDSGTYARMMGNVMGTEQQALIDAAPKLMDATRRSYLDVLNSDITARAGQNAQEIAASNATGMFRGNLTYPAQKDAFQGVMDIANQRETMPSMDTSVLTNPGLRALGDQVNAIAGEERWPVTDPRENRLVQTEANYMQNERAKADAKNKNWTADQEKLYRLVQPWMKANNVPLTKEGYDRALKEFGGAAGMSGQQVMAVIKDIFEGATGSGGDPSLAEQKVKGVSNLTNTTLAAIKGRDRSTQQARETLWKEIQPQIRKLYEDNKMPFGPLSVIEAEDLVQKIIELSDKYPDAKAIIEWLQPGGAG